MSNILSIANAGLNNATAQFNQAATNLINAGANSGDQTNAAVGLLAAKTQVETSVAVTNIADKLSQTLVNILT